MATSIRKITGCRGRAVLPFTSYRERSRGAGGVCVIGVVGGWVSLIKQPFVLYYALHRTAHAGSRCGQESCAALKAWVMVPHYTL